MSALGAAISKAVEKGMQERLSAGITHGAEGRKLVDVAAYNPSVEVDYLSALQRLHNVNFSLIAELKSNKDASVDTIMNLLHLDDALAERLGLTESQPHANQLMVPIHHYPDQRAHTIVVITDQPIKQLLSNPEVSGRLLKWRFELGEHEIQYRLRTSVKGQILADFIVERPEDDTPDTPMEDKEELPDPWILFTDRSSCIDGSEVGLIITNPKGMEFTYALRFRFNATNNEAEYEALVAGLRIAGQMGVQNLQVNVDSKLVSNQVTGIYIAKESSMIGEKNKKVDALNKIASTSFAHLSKQVFVEELREKEIDEKEVLAVVEEEGHT
nr:reverse transcriptase domain-containing protein [Tanacetum cinerariifolium]